MIKCGLKYFKGLTDYFYILIRLYTYNYITEPI